MRLGWWRRTIRGGKVFALAVKIKNSYVPRLVGGAKSVHALIVGHCLILTTRVVDRIYIRTVSDHAYVAHDITG